MGTTIDGNIISVAGPQGKPGPNTVSGSTTTALAGMLYGSGGLVHADPNITTDGAGNESVNTLNVASMADTAAGNSTLYFSTTNGRLSFKDSTGCVHFLYGSFG